MKRMLYFYPVLSVLIMALSCSSPSKEVEKKHGRMTIVYSGNIGARWDPCGCRPPMGGLARRSTILQGIRSSNENVLVLDTGALLFEKHRLYPPYENTSRMTAHLVFDTMNRIGIDAVNVSSMDMAAGADTLIAFDKRSSWPWLSANLVRKDTGELAFTADMVKTVGDLTVGVFGIMDQTTMGIPILDESSPLEVLDPAEAAKREIEKLGNKVDIIVALVYMDKKKIDSFVESVPGMDILIYGHTSEHNPSSDPAHFLPYKVEKTVVARCPDGGRVLGILDLEMWHGSSDFTELIDLRPKEVREADPVTEKTSYFVNTFIHLDPKIKRDLAIHEHLKEVGGKISEIREKIRLENR